MLYPLKFQPIFKDYIWGGRNLEKLGKVLPAGKVAESWEISCNKDGISVVANGEFKGLPLPELIERFGSELLGSSVKKISCEDFPLLLKLIDANDKLSVQVHPDDKYAKVHENGGLGKNEMWYVISVKSGSKLVYGVLPEVTKESFEHAINSNTVELCLNYIDVNPGDVLNIPAGLVHAIGSGIVLAEIQQNSNTTYRVYDYHRIDKDGNKRPLHIEKSLEVIDFDSGCSSTKAEGIEINPNKSTAIRYYVANKYFCVQLYTVNGVRKEFADGSKFEIYLFTEGNCSIEYEGGKISFKAGESVLIPASLGKYSLNGRFKALKTFVPDFEKDVFGPLMAAGFSKEQIFKNLCGLSE